MTKFWLANIRDRSLYISTHVTNLKYTIYGIMLLVQPMQPTSIQECLSNSYNKHACLFQIENPVYNPDEDPTFLSDGRSSHHTTLVFREQEADESVGYHHYNVVSNNFIVACSRVCINVNYVRVECING